MQTTLARILRGLLVLGLGASVATAQAQGERQIEGVVEGSGFTAIRVAVPAPAADPGLTREAEDLVRAVREDLEFSGLFDVIDPALYRLVPQDDPDAPRFDDWLSIGADALVRTRFRVVDGRIALEARLYDDASGTLLFGRRYGGRPDLLRRVAHQLADDLVHHYTGSTGVALTRIVFVSAHGDGKEIYLTDYDGRRTRRLTTSNTINLSPVWSPDGEELAFVSWRGRQPAVYLMSSEGEMRGLDIVGGELSAAPDWSPDGRHLAYSTDADGNTEIYVLDRTSGRNRRLTRNPAIDTSPAFSPNGREIAFTSDRSGTPQIYVMDVDGLNVRRISWSGSYNDSAAWSPRGERLAYVSRIEGQFHVVALDLATGAVTRLTSGRHNNENPRWSPDGRHIVFSSDREGSYDIHTMRADGGNVRRLTRGGDSFTPDWSR